MAPVTPHWQQPSHPTIQAVLIRGEVTQEYETTSISRIHVAPFGIFAKLEGSITTKADEATYATVQVGEDEHINLNSDLLYINHSCEPSVIFDTSSRLIIAGPNGLKPGQELTFFYPSTEWSMAQPFDCNCSTPSCCGRITGAGNMTEYQLRGKFLNAHIQKLLEEKKTALRAQERKEEMRKKANQAMAHDPNIRSMEVRSENGNEVLIFRYYQREGEGEGEDGDKGVTTGETLG